MNYVCRNFCTEICFTYKSFSFEFSNDLICEFSSSRKTYLHVILDNESNAAHLVYEVRPNKLRISLALESSHMVIEGQVQGISRRWRSSRRRWCRASSSRTGRGGGRAPCPGPGWWSGGTPYEMMQHGHGYADQRPATTDHWPTLSLAAQRLNKYISACARICRPSPSVT